jgi:polyhydroxyalkanoate synthesis regulator phasin
MDPKQILKQMIQFNKAAFDNTFDVVTALQEKTEKLIDTYLSQAPVIPEEGKKAITDLLKSCRTGRGDLKAAVDEGFRKAEEYFKAHDRAAGQETVTEPEAVKARPIEKAAKKTRVAKAKTAKKPRKKPRVKKLTNIDKVVRLIQGSTEGISTAQLKEKTGLPESQIWNIINRVSKLGKVKKIRRGVYGAA